MTGQIVASSFILSIMSSEVKAAAVEDSQVGCEVEPRLYVIKSTVSIFNPSKTIRWVGHAWAPWGHYHDHDEHKDQF